MIGSESKVARRYASALFGAAEKTARTDSVEQDLAALGEAWTRSASLRQTLTSPLIAAERKHELVDRALAGADPLTLAFMHLLIDKGREATLPYVRLEFGRHADESRGVLRASATVVAPIDDQERAAIRSGLEQRTGKRIELTVEVDAAILGGVVVRMQDTIIDGSVRGSLERLREHMLRDR